MRSKEKKEITAKTTIKAVITGYIAYGILIGFLLFVLGIVVNWCLVNISKENNMLLSITISLIHVIFIYFALHIVCKLSIYDVFKNCKTNPDNIKKIISRLNLFIIICIMIEIITTIGILVLDFENQQQAIEISTKQYSSIHSEQFTLKLKNEMIREYTENRLNMIIYTIILELGMVVSWFSVIPLQKKLIVQYNKY